MQVLTSASIGYKIVEILSVHGVTSENKTVYIPPTIQSWVFVVSLRQFEQAQHCMRVRKGKALFSPSKTVKFQKVYISHVVILSFMCLFP